MIPKYRRIAALALLLVGLQANADIVADWADTTTAIAIDGPNTIRTMALAQNAVYEAVNAITLRYPRDRVDLGPTQGASIDAAIAAASHAVLLHEAPTQSERTESAYRAAIANLPQDNTRAVGIAVGERAAADILAKHALDIENIKSYRPLTSPGVYVPTTFPLGFAYAQHRPWFMTRPSQFRPGPPTPLSSDAWARDYNETKTMGALNSAVRTAEQTQMVLFWATNLPDVHEGIVRSAAAAPGRDLTRNARLFAAAIAAMNEAEIAIFEAKYHYQFWRPITAIRNGDQDNNSATALDPDWQPLIATPIQPEYPCGHCILASVLATVIRIESGPDPVPSLSSTSNTAPGVTRRWARPEDLVQEVTTARICGGIHFRHSAEVGNHMGEQVGTLVAAAYHLP
jgi:hypothetical protein